MESFIKKTEIPEQGLVELTDTSGLSEIKTIKIKYCPPTFPSIFDARLGLVFVIPLHLTNSINDLCEKQLNITPDIQNGELFLDVSFTNIPCIYSVPLKGLNAIQANDYITEAFRLQISKEYTDALIKIFEKRDTIKEKQARIITMNGRRDIGKAKKPKIEKPKIEKIEEKTTFTPLFQRPPKELDKEKKSKSLNNSPRKEN